MTLTSTPTLTNNTIALNHSNSTSTSAQGAGICAYSGSSCNGSNNIVYGNTATSSPEYTGAVYFTYSCCSQYLSGTGNITGNPLYTHLPGEAYCLLSQTASGQSSQSPCVDAGNSSSVMPDGSTRSDFVQDAGIVDMGYHWSTSFSNWYGEEFDLFTEGELEELMESLIPVSTDLKISNFPNPFNPSTSIQLEMASAGNVELTVTDITGRVLTVLHNGYLQSGVHRFIFSGEGNASGIYFYQAKAGDNIVTGKALLIK